MSLLSVENLRVVLGGRAVVQDVSFSIAPREVLALLGPSGCGKTTTLRAIAGLQAADRGGIMLDGRSLRGVPTERRGVGLVFQDGAVFPHLSVRRNLAFGLPRGISDAGARIDELLRLLGLLGLADRMPHQLSGGQRQRVALGRALAPQPRLLLLDEPFASLDAALKVGLRAELFALLRELGIAALLVTHDQDEALEVADRIGVMREGSLEQLAPPTQILNNPATPFVARFVGGAALVPIEIRDGRVQVGTAERSVAADDGQAFAVIRPDDVGLADRGWSGTVVGRRVRGARRLSRVRLQESGIEVDVPGDHDGEVIVAPVTELRVLRL